MTNRSCRSCKARPRTKCTGTAPCRQCLAKKKPNDCVYSDDEGNGDDDEGGNGANRGNGRDGRNGEGGPGALPPPAPGALGGAGPQVGGAPTGAEAAIIAANTGITQAGAQGGPLPQQPPPAPQVPQLPPPFPSAYSAAYYPQPGPHLLQPAYQHTYQHPQPPISAPFQTMPGYSTHLGPHPHAVANTQATNHYMSTPYSSLQHPGAQAFPSHLDPFSNNSGNPTYSLFANPWHPDPARGKGRDYHGYHEHPNSYAVAPKRHDRAHRDRSPPGDPYYSSRGGRYSENHYSRSRSYSPDCDPDYNRHRREACRLRARADEEDKRAESSRRVSRRHDISNRSGKHLVLISRTHRSMAHKPAPIIVPLQSHRHTNRLVSHPL
ncbi:hypothetical protein RSOLAG1IB_12142 [Rhizoctonia solani AG-1 IB]|uniref:Zn(2)-C6 fungal-type domain-containing protein n=1 Tax=Thanatephorus cucumeris (strain AG1-IB / isolate 7/3/14) TaxID=1108050 RepID=A0A0B7FKP9_THACB|nr:hypothetical protein RSOLAG1IB_12142 [Rhizoctonia solani AG-1 IB]